MNEANNQNLGNQVPNLQGNNQNNKKSNNVLIICITLIIIALIVGGTVIYLNSKSNEPKSENKDKTSTTIEETNNSINNQTADDNKDNQTINDNEQQDKTNNVSNEFIGKYIANSSDSNDNEYFILNTDGTANIHYITGDGRNPYNDDTVNYSIVTENGKIVLKFDTTYPYWNVLDGEKTSSGYKFIPREVGPSATDLTFIK